MARNQSWPTENSSEAYEVIELRNVQGGYMVRFVTYVRMSQRCNDGSILQLLTQDYAAIPDNKPTKGREH